MSDQPFLHPLWTRRDALKAGAAMTAAGLLPGRALAAIPSEFDGSKFQLAAPEPNPKRGGTLRYGITMRMPHFDFHQSGTINNLGSQGCMFDNLIRRDPRDSGKTIIPDLAHSWEIAKDGKINVFVQLHDFHGWDAHALWDDIKFSTTHCTKMQKVAIVGDKTWEKWMAKVCKPFTMAKVKYFDASEANAAKACTLPCVRSPPKSLACLSKTWKFPAPTPI